MKKLVAVILSLVLMVSTFSISVLADNEKVKSVDDMANDLNTIGILLGDGSGYNLEGELKRSEGAAFIVRLLGKEDDVKKNKINYISTDFSDVSATKWYSPYVGCCVEEGIINGYLDGTFKPDDKLNEQSFVKMILGILGYKYNTDFSWDETLTFAYEKGLLKDEKYENMTSSNGKYTRGQVVKVLYNALNVKVSGKQITLIEKLVNDEAISIEKVKEIGLLKDTIEMEIENYTQISDTLITIKFNETPKSFDKENIIFKDKESGKILEVKEVTVDDEANSYTIETIKQTPDKNYRITVTGVRDLENNILQDTRVEFKGYRGKGYTSNYFRISSVENTAANMLDVSFTQPIKENSIRNSDISILHDGRIYVKGDNDNMAVTIDRSNPYILHIELNDFNFGSEEKYTLEMSGEVDSLYRIYLNEEAGEEVDFVSKKYEKSEFTLESIVKESSDTVILNFNRSLSESMANNKYMYGITKLSNEVQVEIEKAELLKTGTNAEKSVKLVCNTDFVDNANYRLDIYSMFDSNMNNHLENFKKDFKPDNAAKEKLKIKSIKTIAANILKVTLDKYLDANSANDINFYTLESVKNNLGVGIIDYVYYDVYELEPTIIIVYQDNLSLKSDTKYRLRIDNNIKTAKQVELISDAIYEFEKDQDDYKGAGIEKACYIGNDSIRIDGTRLLAIDVPNVLATNYKLVYTENGEEKTLNPIGVSYNDERSIIVRFEEIDLDQNYKLIVDSMKTLNGDKVNLSKNPVDLIIEK